MCLSKKCDVCGKKFDMIHLIGTVWICSRCHKNIKSITIAKTIKWLTQARKETFSK